MLTILRCQGCYNQMKDFTMIGMLKVTGVNFLEILKCPAECLVAGLGPNTCDTRHINFMSSKPVPLSLCSVTLL